MTSRDNGHTTVKDESSVHGINHEQWATWIKEPLKQSIRAVKSGYLQHLTNILNLLLSTIPRSQIPLQRPPKDLQQHLKADLRYRRIIPALAQLVPYERMLRVRHLVPGKTYPLLMQSLPYQISPGGGDVVVFLAEYLKPSSSAGFRLIVRDVKGKNRSPASPSRALP